MTSDLSNYDIIVTGASGMVGIPLCQKLTEFGANVVGIGRRKTSAVTIKGDLSDGETLDKALRECADSSRVKILVHLAALNDVSWCRENPQQAKTFNVRLTESVAQKCLEAGVKHILFASTAYVYGTNHDGPVKEDCPVRPDSVYAESKLEAEHALAETVQETGAGCDILRVSNIYGEGVKPNTVFGTIIEQLESTGKVSLFNLKPVRDFIHVDDVTEAMVRLIQASPTSGCRTWNVSTGTGTSVETLVSLVCRLKGVEENVIEERNPDGPETCLVLDNRALKDHLGWSPGIKITDGVSRIIKERQEV